MRIVHVALTLSIALVLLACTEDTLTVPEDASDLSPTSDEAPQLEIQDWWEVPVVLPELRERVSAKSSAQGSAVSVLQSARRAQRSTTTSQSVQDGFYATASARHTSIYYPDPAYVGKTFSMKSTSTSSGYAKARGGTLGGGTYTMDSDIASAVRNTFNMYYYLGRGYPSKSGSGGAALTALYTPERCPDLRARCISRVVSGLRKEGLKVTPLGRGKLELTLPTGVDGSVLVRHVYDIATAEIDATSLLREDVAVGSLPGSIEIRNRMRR